MAITNKALERSQKKPELIQPGPKLIQLLEEQHKKRGTSDLFKQGIFTIQWRAKVGSYPHPDLETMISASEPCGTWRPKKGCPENLQRPEDKRNVGENYQYFEQLPLNGYIPASAIRGLVRSWANKCPEIKAEMEEILGKQENDKIHAGQIQFLDAYPTEANRVTLDIVNPQQDFQIYHDGQSTPLSFYTLGDGKKEITVKVAIRGVEGKITPEKLAKVWSWVEQAMSLYGIGSRTASGYGAIKANKQITITQDPENKLQLFNFSLYSQGCGGVDVNDKERLRPSHWRGWLRSWVLRFLLGVMSKENAEKILGELMGNIDDNNNKSQKGCLRLEMIQGKTWGQKSEDPPKFYIWKGQLKIAAVKQTDDILTKIILPIIQFAVSVGGVGRGWRRPLHIFSDKKDKEWARGCHLIIDDEKNNLTLSPNQPQKWLELYQNWFDTVKIIWKDRINTKINHSLNAEVFSPDTCAIYAVPEPNEEPVDFRNNTWADFHYIKDSRGEGMDLIYDLTYKRKKDVGGDAASGRDSHCSWVSIKRSNTPHPEIKNSDCQEIVCLFMGGVSPDDLKHLRARFLRGLDKIKIRGGKHLFGVTPQI